MGDRHSQRIARVADRLEVPIRVIGQVCGWLTFACVLLAFGVVALRYGFDMSSIRTQELILHLNAAVFLLGGAYALIRDSHVRVDILQQRWSVRTRARVEIAGIVALLLPFCFFLFWISADYVASAWRLHEGSREAGGLPGVYLAKSLIPLSAVLLALAGIVRLLRMLASLASARADMR
jgi:TRAP-type mannitol/chloroaromatic compound transport system permease small subunit